MQILHLEDFKSTVFAFIYKILKLMTSRRSSESYVMKPRICKNIHNDSEIKNVGKCIQLTVPQKHDIRVTFL